MYLHKSSKKRVVIYARVSTAHEAQLYALENQIDWYQSFLEMNPDMELINTYVDEGITGTSAKKRPNFQKMINDARKHQFDLILTREVSRFARNTVDTLQYTRELKRRGIEVYFINDNIRTFDGDGELRLTIMATLAQEESRKMSIRVRAGLSTAIEKGVIFGNGNVLGYDLVDREYILNEEQAQTVRMIFDCRLQGMSYSAIAHEMESRGRLTATGKTRWSVVSVSQVLSNSLYCGVMEHHKEYINDYLEQKRLTNKGEKERVYVAGKHTPIVTEEEFRMVQQIHEERLSGNDGIEGVRKMGNIFGSLLQCSCLSPMYYRKWSRTSKNTVHGYYCSLRVKRTSAGKKRNNYPDCQSPFRADRLLYTVANYVFTGFLGDEMNQEKAAHLMCEKNRSLNRPRNAKKGFFPAVKGIDGNQTDINEKTAETGDFDVPAENHVTDESAVLEEIRSVSREYDGRDIPDEIIKRFTEKIVAGEEGITWFLAYNENKQLLWKLQYETEQLVQLERNELFLHEFGRPEMYCYFHADEAEPNYIWKDFRIKIVI